MADEGNSGGKSSAAAQTHVRPAAEATPAAGGKTGSDSEMAELDIADGVSELEPEIGIVPEAGAAPAAGAKGAILIDDHRIQSIKVKIQVMLGGTNLSVSQLAQLREGDTVALTSKISDPVQILANGQVIGQGKVVVIENDPPTFGVRLENVIDGL